MESISKLYLRAEKQRCLAEVEETIYCKSHVELLTRFNVVLTPMEPTVNLNDDWIRHGPDMIFEDSVHACRISDGSDAPMHLGRVLYGGFLRSVWGHFITESIARMWALEEVDIEEFDCILFFADIKPVELQGNFKLLFELLGIDKKVIVANGAVGVEELVVPELSYEHDVYYSLLQADIYKKIISAALKLPGEVDGNIGCKKIFLCRSGVPGATRDAVNLLALERYFEANGFSLIRPEATSLVDLIHMMDQADEIATISGSLAHNYVFVNNPGDKKLIIIERHAWVNLYQVSLNKMLGLPVVSVDGFYLPRLATSKDGVWLFAPTRQFCEFARDNGFSQNGAFVGSNYFSRLKELHRFVARYRRYMCSGNAVCDWEIDSGRAITEAIIASNERYEEWLAKGVPLMWFDYFSPWAVARLLREILRKIVRKLRGGKKAPVSHQS